MLFFHKSFGNTPCVERLQALHTCGGKLLSSSVARLHALNALKIHEVFCGAVKIGIYGAVEKYYFSEAFFRKSHVAAHESVEKSFEERAAAGSGRCHNSP